MLRVFIFILLCFAASCNKPYLYDKIGFGPGDRPKNYWNPQYPARMVAPIHSVVKPISQPLPYNPGAGSRFYSNPYAIPPSQQYQRYDVDQYYYPPNYQYDLEGMQLYQLHKELLPES